MRHLFVLSFIFLFLACKKEQPKDCSAQCTYLGATITFNGYTKEEVDTVYLRSYKRNGSFDSLQKIELVSKTDSAEVPGMPSKCLSSIGTSPDLDYEVFIPSTTQTFRIASKFAPKTNPDPCDYKHPCIVPWQGASITGGKCTTYLPPNAYIILWK